jgi:hypothetical protein
MGNFSADDVIGKTLVAKRDVTAFSNYPKSAKTKVISSGSNVGVVYSWVKDPDNGGNVYWAFHEPYGGGLFFIKHDPSSLIFHPEEIVKTVEQKKKEKEDAAKMDQEGALPYYIEKYGKPVMVLAAVALAIKGYSVYSGSKSKQ